MHSVTRSITFFGLSLCAAPLGCTQDTRSSCSAPVVSSSTRLDGSKFELSIPQTALREAPGWQIGGGEPPVSIAKAVQIATTWAAGHRQRFDELRIQELTLDNVSCVAGDGHWYYRVTFLPIQRGSVVADMGWYVIAILMNGKVIETHKVTDGS